MLVRERKGSMAKKKKKSASKKLRKGIKLPSVKTLRPSATLY